MAHMQNDGYNVNDNHKVLMSTKQFRRKRSRKVIPTVPEKWKEEFDKLALKPRSIQIKLLNPHITCPVCQGYLVDATTITECLHSICRSCIVKHFERVRCNYKCPLCHELVHKTNPWYNLKTDCVLQDIVNKLVPDFAEAEERRRIVFYKSRGLAIPDKVIKPDIQRPQINHTTVTKAESTYSQSHSQQVQEAQNLLKIYYSLTLDHDILKSIIMYIFSVDEFTLEDIEPLKRKFVRCSNQVTIGLLQAFLAKKLNLEAANQIGIICNDMELGSDLTWQFIKETIAEEEVSFHLKNYQSNYSEKSSKFTLLFTCISFSGQQ
ncbi:polycomb group RING finger protein 3-like [Xenia sp. Carnegie-2017]|uniref:polycomb group RING finger protein 3-like n=1 Tax=Xenia sp. Carnegie-2017 TaxID=2897299 RepID=UPI001F039641|nr:polycomb group RING finger protein 3-like [Xenia sp. Carnegie-2017]